MDSNTTRSEVINAIKWVAFGKIAAQTLRWGMTFWVIRLLVPADYGYVALASVSLSFFTLLFGSMFAPYLIQRKELDTISFENVYGIIILVHFGSFALQYALADPIALAFGSEVVGKILRVNSVCFLILALETIPHALLTRNMEFKKLSIIDALANGTAAATTLILALSGFGFWALVIGEVVLVATRASAILFVQPMRVTPSFRGQEWRQILSFGGPLTLHAVIAYGFVNMDIIVAGATMSATSVGLYAVALQVALMPHKKILPILRQVAFPAFSRLQDDKRKISWFVMKAQRLSFILTIPVFWGFAAIAHEAIPLVLGVKWESAGLPTAMILSIMPLRFCMELFAPALKAQRLLKHLIINSLIASIIMLIAFLLGSRYDVNGLALAWSLGFPLAFVLTTSRNLSVLSLSWAQLLHSIKGPVLSGAFMLAAISGVHYVSISNVYLSLVIQIVIGGLSYVLCLRVLDKNSITEVLSLRR